MWLPSLLIRAPHSFAPGQVEGEIPMKEENHGYSTLTFTNLQAGAYRRLGKAGGKHSVTHCLMRGTVEH